MLTAKRVCEIARAGRVLPDPSYHGFEHHVRFEDLRTNLAFCHTVVKDTRQNPEGTPEHPQGYVAWCTNWGGVTMRIDFNLVERGDGELILVVTGWRLET